MITYYFLWYPFKKKFNFEICINFVAFKLFRKKYNTDSSIQTFKTRLFVKGFTQKEDIDYFDTYYSVARITSIRVLFALVSIYKLYVH